jgi:hypothetical protein
MISEQNKAILGIFPKAIEKAQSKMSESSHAVRKQRWMPNGTQSRTN